MKRFVIAFAICALMLAPGAYAQTNYYWNGAGLNDKWENPANWVGAGFPAGGAVSRPYDRAVIDTDAAAVEGTVLWDGMSGALPFNNRTVVDIMVDTRTNSEWLRLQVNGDLLFVTASVILMGGADGELATLHISDGAFEPKVLLLDSSVNDSEVKIWLEDDLQLTISEETRIWGGGGSGTGTVDFVIEDRAIMNTGMLIMQHESTINKTGAGVLSSS